MPGNRVLLGIATAATADHPISGYERSRWRCSQAAVPSICVSFFGATRSVDLRRRVGVRVTKSRLISGALGHMFNYVPVSFHNWR